MSKRDENGHSGWFGLVWFVYWCIHVCICSLTSLLSPLPSSSCPFSSSPFCLRSLIAVAFVDLIRSCGAFSRAEADETLASGFLNGLFVVARSIGLLAHAMDQRRLKQELYRHDTGDITYFSGAF